MSEQPNMKMPKDAAQVVFWFKGLPQPTAFLTLRDEADKAVEAIKGAAATGKIGDGKIFVLNVEDAVRIRTGETGTAAL